jgi:hypothetical protein
MFEHKKTEINKTVLCCFENTCEQLTLSVYSAGKTFHHKTCGNGSLQSELEPHSEQVRAMLARCFAIRVARLWHCFFIFVPFTDFHYFFFFVFSCCLSMLGRCILCAYSNFCLRDCFTSHSHANYLQK